MKPNIGQTLHFPAPASYFVRTLRRLSTGTLAAPYVDDFFTSVTPVKIRFKNEARIKAKEGWCTIFASNTNPPEESNISKTSDTARGPPFLTILAGFVVLSGIFWILGSTVMWLFGFLVRPPH